MKDVLEQNLWDMFRTRYLASATATIVSAFCGVAAVCLDILLVKESLRYRFPRLCLPGLLSEVFHGKDRQLACLPRKLMEGCIMRGRRWRVSRGDLIMDTVNRSSGIKENDHLLVSLISFVCLAGISSLVIVIVFKVYYILRLS
jgi:hypothetical protein